MFEPLIALFGAVLGPYITNYFKKKKVDPKVALLITATFVGCGVVLYNTFLPPSVQENVVSAVAMFTTATVFSYEFMMKKYSKEKKYPTTLPDKQ